ncbi:MAG: MBL fold metallo-hydrolase [Candidatus Saganbacteria bacterium]|nr:MBL fold metallo-hydrolase [Candidatus Saganbacteria bacterium]
MMNIPIDVSRPQTWSNLHHLPVKTRKEWINHNLANMIKVLHALPIDENSLSPDSNQNPWHLIGFICINDNLYKEAEKIYEEMQKKMKESHKNFGIPSYYLGIAKFLQGRHKEAYAEFKTSRQYDLLHKIFDSPSAAAIHYMEETIFPTKEIIHKNQEKLIDDLNIPRCLEKVFGTNKLRTIHKWNSSSPLFSRAVSQGGGYFLTLRNPHGEIKGIAIDPGYDFFTIFRDIGLGIADIDAIIITHDHDDHTESVEGILSLLAKYNDHNHEKKSRVIDIFGSAGVLLKFHGLLSATDLFGNKEINFKLLVPGNIISEIEGASLKEKYGITVYVKQAHHTERWTNQESSVGLVLETNIPSSEEEPHTLCIGITGDTRYENGLGVEYKDCQLLLTNIGSIEKEEGKYLNQHLGLLGCINLIKEARLRKPLLSILTEFGEEFSGKRKIISQIIENWVQPMEENHSASMLRVIPADINLEVRLSDLHIKETDTNVFFPYQMITIEEDSNFDTLKYKLKAQR